MDNAELELMMRSIGTHFLKDTAWSCRALLTLGLIAAATIGQGAAGAEEADSIDRDYSAVLTRLPPTPASRALETFEVEPGFKLQLAAAEPLVADPVAIDFDEHGRAYVVAMLGYSENAADMLGRVRMLEDADRDGQFDTSTVFAEGLSWPTAVICYDGGIFVGAAPDILYFKDADGDGRADERRVVFTGFGTHNVQGLLNSFRWGLDNRIHVAVSSCGADLRRGDQPDAEPLVLRGRNFAFDPRTLQFEATSGASQHGFCFDAWGNAFTCSNSDHIQQIVLQDKHLSRNPLMRSPPVLKNIAPEGPAADVFRISPVEPWRKVRTRLRAKGIVPGIVEGGGRAAGYFTSATGVTIYTGDAWPEEFHGNAFIGDVGSNLIHRKRLQRRDDAVAWVAWRATAQREFVASSDTWFRPVQFANGPDGNLYVLDMYREVIEHPDSLPPVIKKHLDLTSGRDRGRIYRVVREDYALEMHRARMSHAMPAGATTDELVAMLAHPNGWHRTTAARLLYERNDPDAAQELSALFQSKARTSGRILALHLLASLKHLDAATLQHGLADADSRIREHAAQIAGQWLVDHAATAATDAAALEDSLIALADDADLHVRFQAALALGDVKSAGRIPALAAIAKRNGDDEYVHAAVFSSLATDAEKLLHELLAAPAVAKPSSGRNVLVELCRQIGARGAADELAAAADDFAALHKTASPLGGELIVALLDGAGGKREAVRNELARHAAGATEEIISGILARSRELAADEQADVKRRTTAIGALPLGRFEETAPTIAELLNPRQPQEIQAAALAAFAQYGAEADVASPVLAAWPGMSPAVRQQAADLLLSRSKSANGLLAGIESGAISPRDLDPAAIQRLKTHADAAVREQAAKVLEDAVANRSEIVDAHLDVLDLTGNAERGREIFAKNCAICHRKDGHGTEVGADLATVLTRTPEALLIAILDPNREVDPKYIQYTVLTVDGLARSGMIAGETAASVTLKGAENITHTIPRADIDQLQSTGVTLMPEGFEKTIDKQSLADLIAYLRDN